MSATIWTTWRRLRGHRLDLGLVLIAVVLVGIVLADRGRVSTEEAEKRRFELLDAWRSDQIEAITYKGKAHSFALTAEDDELGRSWSLTVDGKPVPVDDQAAEALLVDLEYAGFERRVEGLSRAELGLEPPRAQLTISMPPLSYAIDIGKEAPGGGAYIEVQGGARGTVAYVISAEVLERLRIDPADLRSRRLAPYLSISVQAFDVAYDGTHFSIERGGWGGRTAGAFQVKTDRATVRADRRVLDGWFTALGQLSAQSFVPLVEADPEDAATITFRPQDAGDPVGKLIIGGACAEPGQIRVVRRGVDPVAACAPKDVIERLLIDPIALFDRYVVGTAAGDITEMRFEAGSLAVDVARKGTGWTMRVPAQGTADDEAMEALLDQIVTATGERLSRQEARDLEALGLADPVAELRIIGLAERTGEGEVRTEIIYVGARKDDFIHLLRKDDGEVLRLPYEAGRVFLPNPEALRSLQIINRPLAAVRGLSLDCGHPQRMTRSSAGVWTLESPEAPLIPDLALANSFADKFRQLRALRWAAGEAEPRHELSDPWCTISLRVAPPGEENEETVVIELGAEIQGGYFARKKGEPGVFVAPRAAGLSASRWLLDRTALMIDPAEVTAVALEGPEGRKLNVQVSGERWVASAGGLGEQVRAALTDLVAEGVVALGEPEARFGFDEPRLRITVSRASGDPYVIEVGSGEVWRDTNVFFVRRDDLGATFAVAQARVRPLLDAL